MQKRLGVGHVLSASAADIHVATCSSSHVPIRLFHEAPQNGCKTCDARRISSPHPYLTLLIHKLCTCTLKPPTRSQVGVYL